MGLPRPDLRGSESVEGQIRKAVSIYLNLKGLIKINDTAMLETLPLEEGL